MSTATTVSAPVTRGWTSRFGLVWFGIWLAWLVPIQLALPEQLDHVDPGHSIRDFGIINGVVGVVAIITLPLFGALCDRTRSPFGRRRVWVVIGLAVFAAGIVASGLMTQWMLIGVAWTVASVGYNILSATLAAVVADQVPEQQRGVISAAMYGPQAVGILFGVVAVGGLSDLGRYLVIAAVLVVCVLPWLLRQRDVVPASGAGTVRIRDIFATMAVDPRADPDFAWGFAGRLLVNLGNALGTTQMLFFLRDGLRVHDPDGTLTLVLLAYLAATLIATWVAGTLSDRSGKRRIFVAWAAALSASSGVLLALAPSLPMTYVAAALAGAGYGAYMAVDQALITAVLPAAEDRAKDLGIMNIGSAGPQAFGALFASGLINASGFGLLFTVSAVVAIAGTLMVYRIKSVP
ncbi:MFS transporter [Nocardioides sp.]|uniref:MFS transporter n=1 Tax=Nocardioides sp. TaxID=35761 RepID=UPI00261ED9FD|nr:MFS transporter [Nocardioides sp.]